MGTFQASLIDEGDFNRFAKESLPTEIGKGSFSAVAQATPQDSTG